MRVRVHLNLHTGLWSVTALHGPSKGRVIASEPTVTLSDCRFIVSEARRQWTIAHKARQVHAWVEGELCAPMAAPPNAQAFSYNPYKAGYFYNRATGEPLTTAARAYFTPNKGSHYA